MKIDQTETLKRGLTIANSLEGQGYSVVAGGLSTIRAEESFMDLFLTQGHNLGIAMGDILAQDIRVDAITRNAKDILRKAARYDRKPHQVLGDLNAKFFKDVKELERNISLIYAWYEPSTRAFLYTGTGHLQAVVINNSSDEQKKLKTNSLMAGGSEDYKYILGGIRLKAGDIVLMYTPSLIEGLNPCNMQKGLDELIGLIKINSFNKAKEIIFNLNLHLKKSRTYINRENNNNNIILLKVKDG